jgi:hypothetical protein
VNLPGFVRFSEFAGFFRVLCNWKEKLIEFYYWPVQRMGFGVWGLGFGVWGLVAASTTFIAFGVLIFGVCGVGLYGV